MKMASLLFGSFNTACAALLLALPVFSQNQPATVNENAPQRVSFTISNASLRGMELEIRAFDYAEKKRIGYGCRLGALASRSDNKPVGTRIYVKKDGKLDLKYVLSADDNGRKIDLTKNHEISREQWLQVACDEQNEATAALENIAKNPDTEAVAKLKGLQMISFRVSGKSLFGRHIHVRAQLPWAENRSNDGFSRRLSRFDVFRASFPVGTKIYLCEGPYWNGPVAEKLVLTVDAEKANYLIRL